MGFESQILIFNNILAVHAKDVSNFIFTEGKSHTNNYYL